jgi:hypothetical protein
VDALNLYCFSQAHWEIIARGFDTEKWFNDGQAAGTGGILMPRPIDMNVGNRYYRFTSSQSSRESQLGGGWWIEYKDFRTIEVYAWKNGLGLSDSARLFLALPYAWTRADRLVSAILEVPLRAYAGLGKVASTREEKWTPLQHIKVMQLYVPGLYRVGAKDQLFERAFPNPRVERVATRQTISLRSSAFKNR